MLTAESSGGLCGQVEMSRPPRREKPDARPAAPATAAGSSAHNGCCARSRFRGPGGLRGALILFLATQACGGPNIRELQPGEPVTPDPWVFDPAYEYQSEYRVRVGDEILIEFLSDPEPATNASRVIVRPDGRISVRGVDDVLAAGRTPAELDSALTAEFGRILVDPSLSVIITRFAGERVYTLGEVVSPREIPLTGPLTALQAIASSGGFTVKAKRSDVVLVRPMGGGRVAAVKLNLEAMLTEPGQGQDLALRGQDVLIVPKSAIGKVGDVIELYFRNINPALITVLTISEIYQNELFRTQ